MSGTPEDGQRERVERLKRIKVVHHDWSKQPRWVQDEVRCLRQRIAVLEAGAQAAYDRGFAAGFAEGEA